MKMNLHDDISPLFFSKQCVGKVNPPFSCKLALKVALYSSKSHIHGSFCFTLLPPSIFFDFNLKKEQFLPGCHTQGNIQISRPGNIPNLKKVLVIFPTKNKPFHYSSLTFQTIFTSYQLECSSIWDIGSQFNKLS